MFIECVATRHRSDVRVPSVTDPSAHDFPDEEDAAGYLLERPELLLRYLDVVARRDD